ncbi:MAG: cobalamin-dependent protein [Elusimicrobia bacterium]|nr:cobalamin-dependent protein [Elusimicrobiota bacterium]
MKDKVKVGLVQINNSFSNQNYFPYTVGILQAYAEKYLTRKTNYEFLIPIYKRIPIKLALQQLSDADIVFFSVYTWNIKISLEIAKMVKKNKPGTIIVFGGPEIPINNTEYFLKKNTIIDIACIGEGEKSFLSILRNYEKRNWEEVPSIAYIDDKGKYIKKLTCERISDLNEIPSPYTNDIFKPLMDANPKENWVGLWETNRGCPFSCTYCVWGSVIQNKICTYSFERLSSEIDWFSRNKIEFIFCCDANYGIFPKDIEIVKYLAKNKKKYGYPIVFSVQNTKNSTMRIYNIYKIMSDAGLSKGVSLAFQSVNSETLKSIKRTNISIETFYKLQKLFNKEHIETFTDVILGLPCETYKTFTEGVSSIIENGQHNRIQFNNLSILTNSEMDNKNYQKKYSLKIIETKLINIHGSISDTDEVQETQRLVIGTKSMPKDEWIRARIFGWMVSLLYFNKLLQVPFIVLNRIYSLKYEELIEIFMTHNKSLPIIDNIYSFFYSKAKDIQCGGTEFCKSKEWLNIWWPADEFMLIKLCTENKFQEFYKEAEQLISKYLVQRKKNSDKSILHETITFNKNLLKMPFQDKNIKMSLSYNIWDIYNAKLVGKDISLKKGKYYYEIDCSTKKWLSWEDWCREVVWWGYKRGAYLYDCKHIKQ